MDVDQAASSLDKVLADVKFHNLQQAAAVVWDSVHRHPANAACECLVIDALWSLYEQGFRLVKEES